MTVIAPLNAAQVYVPPLNGVAHPLAGEVMNAMLGHGTKPVGLWKIVNSLANAQNPDSRAHRRSWRLRYLCSLRELLRAGVLFRHGPLVATSNFPMRPKPKSPRRLFSFVARLASEIGGSSPVVPVAKTAGTDPQTPEPKLVVTSQSTQTGDADKESATPAASEISAAASALARLPRTRKKWSGWLNGDRMWRMRPVVVPGGNVLPVFFVRRNFIYALPPDTREYEGQIFLRYKAEDVQLYRSPHAALLGRLPPRAGSRRRGRPLKSS